MDAFTYPTIFLANAYFPSKTNQPTFRNIDYAPFLQVTHLGNGDPYSTQNLSFCEIGTICNSTTKHNITFATCQTSMNSQPVE